MKRIRRAAKFFFEGGEKWELRGVTYGPFRPRGPEQVPFPESDTMIEDFKRMRACGLNCLRTYHAPPMELMDLAGEHGLRVVISIPWPLRGLFLHNSSTRREILRRMCQCAIRYQNQPALLGYFVDNEFPPDLVRWSGQKPVVRFLDRCITAIREHDSDALLSYAGYPSSEYVLPSEVDFVAFNVYLHEPERLALYLKRLQSLSGDKPLVLSEFGMDTLRHPPEEQEAFLRTTVQQCRRAGLAGHITFAWTDEWHTGGADIEDWHFGLVRKDRSPKAAYLGLQKLYEGPDKLADSVARPKVSVVVCTYNGSKTIESCLEGLQGMDYPDYEILVVDDGSTDNTAEKVRKFSGVRLIQQANHGLGFARNTGISASCGDVVAFTDDDCVPDREWLSFLVRTLQIEQTAAVGGPNISPPARDWVQATVAAAPGSPSHVLLSDDRAEHIPGCNMAFRKDALTAIGGFDPVYRKAGDDVDVCWKLLNLGEEIAFAPAAVVWHRRRFTVKAYLRQQAGYGEAEGLLRLHHLNRFDSSGSAQWTGSLYGSQSRSLPGRAIIYFGSLGNAPFQAMYQQPGGTWILFMGSFPWMVALVLSLVFSFGLPYLRGLPLLFFGGMLFSVWYQMIGARLEIRHDGFKSRLLLLYLIWVQPLIRSWARLVTWMERQQTPRQVQQSEEQLPHGNLSWWRCNVFVFWSETGIGRLNILEGFINQLKTEGWCFSVDSGWTPYDCQIFANRWWRVWVTSQNEAHEQGAILSRVRLEVRANNLTFLVLIALGLLGLSLSLVQPACIPVLGGGLFMTWALLTWKGLRVRRRVAESLLATTRRMGVKRLKNLS